MPETPTVLYSEHDHVALISLNRPDQMNASSRQLRKELGIAMDAADKNPHIRVVVLTGEGRGFSAGADLTETFNEDHASVSDHILKDHKVLIDKICNSDKTYIAALNGATAGIMLGYAMACDLIIMAEKAFMYCPFFAISLVPDGGVSWFVLKHFGYQRAFEMIVQGRRMTAAECLEAGATNKVVADDELRAAALEWGADIATSSAPLTLKYAKRILRLAETGSREDVTMVEAMMQNFASQSADCAEGITAFMEKRKPKFEGK